MAFFVIYLAWFAFCLPQDLFKTDFSTVLYAKDGSLLGARIANDFQWRFPTSTILPQKFETCLIEFEDKNFFRHPGVNPFSIARAIKQNISNGKTISGGSTLSMQVIRLSEQGKARTIFRKFLEMNKALRLELRYSKEEILQLYYTHAPFGGNIVGIETASYRYYGRNPEELSWAEAAILAVLPNAPSLIYPGKNQSKLIAKRNRLLEKLKEKGIIDELTCTLAKAEPAPDKFISLPNLAPHLLQKTIHDGHKGEQITSTIQKETQIKTLSIANKYSSLLIQNGVNNVAILVLDIRTNDVLAYVGNTGIRLADNNADVDIIQAKRSTGSLLKPFLYALMQHEGYILPKTLVADYPIFLDGFAPKNFDNKYSGAISADVALYKSLNIPAVLELREYGLEKYLSNLKRFGLFQKSKPAAHYGLSLVLGAGEESMWNLARGYSSLGRSVYFYNRFNGDKKYLNNAFCELNYLSNSKNKEAKENSIPINAAAAWVTLEAMTKTVRPYSESNWQYYDSGKKVAWKTGTSFGNRDAWAIGLSGNYLVAVWTGNADGEGRPGLTGASSSAPIMFDVFQSLPNGNWFKEPSQELIQQKTCSQSGMRAGQYCKEITTEKACEKSNNTQTCKYHVPIMLDKTNTFRVHSDCYSVLEMQKKVFFVLPPIMAYYYESANLIFDKVPAYSAECKTKLPTLHNMEMIYPLENTRIKIIRDLDGEEVKTVFELAHHQPNTSVYWHLDGEFLGTTKNHHKIELLAKPGKHIIHAIDENGEQVQVAFIVDGETKLN